MDGEQHEAMIVAMADFLDMALLSARMSKDPSTKED